MGTTMRHHAHSTLLPIPSGEANNHTALLLLYSQYIGHCISWFHINNLFDQYQWLQACQQNYSYFIETRKTSIGFGMNTPPTNITQLLHQWQDGDQQAMDVLCPLIYQELHRLAAHYMHKERAGHTLQTTALVNEAFAKLVDAELPIQNRQHFYRIAARQMRRILVDHARAKHRKKRGENAIHVAIDENRIADTSTEADLIAIDEALNALKAFDPRKHDIIELLYFAGLSHKEVASMLGISQKTVQRELRLAEAWLHDALTTPHYHE